MASDERLPARLREAFLLGYEPLGPGDTAFVVREAAAGRALRQQALRDRRARRTAAALAGVLAVAIVATLVAVRFGGSASSAHHLVDGGPPVVTVPAAMPSTSPTPDAGAAVVYLDYAHDNTHLQRVDYGGHRLGPAWTMVLPPATPPSGPGVIKGVAGISPNGGYVATLDGGNHNLLFLDTGGRTLSSIPLSVFNLSSYAWADDSRHVCQVSTDASGRPQLVVADITASPVAERSVPIDGLQFPQSTAVKSCSIHGGRAVLIEGLSADSFPKPGSTAQQLVLVVQLSTGRVTGQVALGPTLTSVVSLDGRYLAEVDAQQQASTIVDLTTRKTVAVEHREVRGFSADDSRVVENSQFQLQNGADVGTAFVTDWRSGQVLFARPGWVNGVRTRPGSADVAIDVMRTVPTGELGGPLDLVIVPAAAPPIVLPGLASY